MAALLSAAVCLRAGVCLLAPPVEPGPSSAQAGGAADPTMPGFALWLDLGRLAGASRDTLLGFWCGLPCLILAALMARALRRRHGSLAAGFALCALAFNPVGILASARLEPGELAGALGFAALAAWVPALLAITPRRAALLTLLTAGLTGARMLVAPGALVGLGAMAIVGVALRPRRPVQTLVLVLLCLAVPALCPAMTTPPGDDRAAATSLLAEQLRLQIEQATQALEAWSRQGDGTRSMSEPILGHAPRGWLDSALRAGAPPALTPGPLFWLGGLLVLSLLLALPGAAALAWRRPIDRLGAICLLGMLAQGLLGLAGAAGMHEAQATPQLVWLAAGGVSLLPAPRRTVRQEEPPSIPRADPVRLPAPESPAIRGRALPRRQEPRRLVPGGTSPRRGTR